MERIIKQITAAGTAVSNSTTEGSLAQCQFGPSSHSLRPGKRYSIDGYAHVTAQNSTDTDTMRLRWGTDGAVPGNNTAVGASAAVDAAVDDIAVLHAVLEVQTETRATILGTISDCDASGSKLENEFAAVLTIDQSTTYYLDYTAQWSAASSGDSIRAESFVVTELV